MGQRSSVAVTRFPGRFSAANRHSLRLRLRGSGVEVGSRESFTRHSGKLYVILLTIFIAQHR